MNGKLALVFSGGGAKGAFGVGVLLELARRCPDLRWDVVSGTSTGALITPFAALAREEEGALEALRDLYLGARKRSVVASNFGLRGILGLVRNVPEGLYNFDPLRAQVTANLGRERLDRLAASPVAAVVNAVSLQTGELVLCTQDRHRPVLEAWFERRAASASLPPYRFLPFEKFRRAMVASSSIPGAIEPVRLGGEQLVDGGVIDVAPLRAAIAAGATAVIAVLMSPRRSPPDPAIRENPLTVALRAIDLLTDEILRNDVEYAEQLTALRPLAERLLAEEGSLPTASADGVRFCRPVLERIARKTSVDVAVIEPPMSLGETLDFDSEVPRGWPDAVEPGWKVGVMQARFDAGVRAAAAALEREDLRAIVERFSAAE